MEKQIIIGWGTTALLGFLNSFWYYHYYFLRQTVFIFRSYTTYIWHYDIKSPINSSLPQKFEIIQQLIVLVGLWI